MKVRIFDNLKKKNCYQVGGVNGLGNLSASDLGIGTGGLGAPFGSGLNTGGAGPMNNSSMHQSNFF